MARNDLDRIAYNKFVNGEITLTEYIKYQNSDKIMEKKGAMKILKDFRDKSALFSVRTALDIIIPELKESEDEKVRKALIEMVHDTTGDELWGDYNVHKEDALTWLEKQCERKLVNFDEAEKEKSDFVGDGFIRCFANFLDFKEGETYWLEYIGDDNYNVRSDNLLGKMYHITPCQLYTVFKKITWLEKQGEQHSPIDISKMVDEFAHTEVNGYGIPSMIEVDAYHKGIEDTLKKQSEQKPVDKIEPKFIPADWSEEDKARIKQLLGWTDTLKNYIHYDALVSLELRRERIDKVSKLESWLKSLKRKIGQGLDPDKVIEWLRYHIQVDEPKIEYNEDGQPLAESFIAHAEARCMAADKVIERFKKDFKL